MLLWAVIILTILERLNELRLTARNHRLALARGGQEHFPRTYRNMVLMQVLFFGALILESYPWQPPLDKLTLSCLVALACAQALRYWSIYSLGELWNTRIIVVPGAKVVRDGPYRFMRHPNYLALTMEFLFIPLLARAPITLLLFSIANLFALRQRISCEEQALRENTDYSQKFPKR